MRIPDNVRISGIPYAIEIIPAKAGALNTKFAAAIDYDGQTIAIGEQAPESMRVSFWHEVIHGMLSSLGLDEHDEKLVEGLAHQMFLFVKDNPEVFQS